MKLDHKRKLYILVCFRIIAIIFVLKYHFMVCLSHHDQHENLLIFMMLFEVVNIKMTWEWL